MANTYSKIYQHVVFAVRNRQALITEKFETPMYEYMSGIVTNQGQKLLIGNGHHDHVHLLMTCKPTCCLDQVVREVKEHTTKFINQNRLVPGKFQWQNGYGAFSVGHQNLDMIFNYIRKQKEHHTTVKFREEYLQLLKDAAVEYDEKYIFDELV